MACHYGCAKTRQIVYFNDSQIHLVTVIHEESLIEAVTRGDVLGRMELVQEHNLRTEILPPNSTR